MPLRTFIKKELAWTVLVLALAIAGCKGQGPGSGEDGISAPVPPVFQQKIYLNEADFEQVAGYVTVCQGKKICISLCHRPPGNPRNARHRVLPLSATAAHLRHGGPDHPRDYLGECLSEDMGEGDVDEPAEEPTEDPTEDVNEEEDECEMEDPPEDSSEEAPEEIPLWCQEVFARDVDCDGIDDETGELLFGDL